MLVNVTFLGALMMNREVYVQRLFMGRRRWLLGHFILTPLPPAYSYREGYQDSNDNYAGNRKGVQPSPLNDHINAPIELLRSQISVKDLGDLFLSHIRVHLQEHQVKGGLYAYGPHLSVQLNPVVPLQ